MLQLLLTYWPVLLLLQAPRLAQVIALVIAKRVQGTLDHRIPDDMPSTAGEWLVARLSALRIGVTAVITDKHTDAYRIHDRLIQLHDTTHFKADPVYWAIAAHELGHARIRHERPVIAYLRMAGVAWSALLLRAGIAALAAYMLYATPLAGQIAFACFAVMSALKIFTLLDEAAASIVAYRELHANAAIDFVHLRAIRAVLFTAFFTYLATYGSYALLLTQWSLLDAVALPLGRAELTTLGWIAVGGLSVAAVVAWRKDDGMARWAPILFLLPLVWNVIDPAYTWCVIAAIAASWQVWYGVAHAPFGLPYVALSRLFAKLEGPGVDKTRDYVRLRIRGAKLIAAGNARLEALTARWRTRPHPANRALAYLRFGYLPLLVAIWL